MEESYIIWQNKSSKELNLICENVIVSQPEQKIKILNTQNRDNNYNYTALNAKNRAFFENRIITVSAFYTFDTIKERSEKLSKIIEWLYSYNYNADNILEVIPDFQNVYWHNVKIENIQTFDTVSMHTANIIFQFRADAFSTDKAPQVVQSGNTDFTNGKYKFVYNNIGFYNDDIQITAEGGCNYLTITNLDNNIIFDIKNGFTQSCVIDFKNKKIIIDGVENTAYDFNFYELLPQINTLVLQSDNTLNIKISSVNRYLFSFPENSKNTLTVSLLNN